MHQGINSGIHFSRHRNRNNRILWAFEEQFKPPFEVRDLQGEQERTKESISPIESPLFNPRLKSNK